MKLFQVLSRKCTKKFFSPKWTIILFGNSVSTLIHAYLTLFSIFIFVFTLYITPKIIYSIVCLVLRPIWSENDAFVREPISLSVWKTLNSRKRLKTWWKKKWKKEWKYKTGYRGLGISYLFIRSLLRGSKGVLWKPFNFY